MILCTNCGKQNENDSAFCTSCGHKLTEERFIAGKLILLGDDGNREYPIADSTRSIGRDATNDVVVEDDEMSAQHASPDYS